MTCDAKTHRPARRLVGFALLVCLALIPQIAIAEILIENAMESGVTDVTTGPRFFAYHQGSQTTFDETADFDQGTHLDTVASGTVIRLDTGDTGPAWWDQDWGRRRCFDVDNDNFADLDEHQVRLVIDTTDDLDDGLVQPDGADYRAIAADGTTELDLWLETGLGTTETIIWVQLDIPYPDTSFCLYFDNAAATSVSSKADVFTYSSVRELYYPLYWNFDGSTGPSGSVQIVSYIDNNTVQVGGQVAVLSTGQVATLSGVTSATTIRTSGPISGKGLGGGLDALVPISFAGTEMVFPTSRYTERWTMASPTGQSAAVNIYNGTTLVWSGSFGSVPTSVAAEITGNRAAVIRSTNGVPFLLTHVGEKNGHQHDSVVLPPFVGDDLFGVRSRDLRIGFADGGSATAYWSNGGASTLSAGAGDIDFSRQNADLRGDGTAARISDFGPSPIGAIQQRDADGFESSSFLPERLLENEYYLPTDANYLAFACPTSMTIKVGGTNVACTASGSNPGHGHHGAASAGDRVWSDTGEPFFVYYEHPAEGQSGSNGYDESNLLGMKSAMAWAQHPPTVTEIPQAPAPTLGTWTSPPIDTTGDGTNAFGLLDIDADVPDGTKVTAQIARGNSLAAVASAPFLGPDGTSATTFDIGTTPIPHGWDFSERYYLIRLTLEADTEGDTPTVDLVSLGYDLAEVFQSSSHSLTVDPTEDREWVLRIWTEDPVMAGATATTSLVGWAGLTGADSATSHLDGVNQFIITNGTIDQYVGGAVAIGPGLPQSLGIDTAGMTGTTLAAVWHGRVGSGILIPHELQIEFN